MNKYEKIKKRLAERMVRAHYGRENQKYGEFIKQTNEVQYLLALVVFLRSTFVDKDYKNRLFEKAGLGGLIDLYRASASETISAWTLLKQLQDYKKDRDRLAHKMFTSKKLTPSECDAAIRLGNEILKKLYRAARIHLKSNQKHN